jgi:hypothetical protein
VAALNTIQSRLSQVADENGVSRRRVRKLELESCKADVARERTRVLEREEALAHKPGGGAALRARGRKALKQLIGSLRAHLQRLTAEMSAHKDLLGQGDIGCQPYICNFFQQHLLLSPPTPNRPLPQVTTYVVHSYDT